MSSSALSLWVAQERGIFAKHGVDAQLILIRGGSTLVASLLTGEIQLAFTSGVSVLGAAAQGVEVKMLTSISSRVSWKLIANPQIKTRRRFARQALRRAEHRRQHLDVRDAGAWSSLVWSRSATTFRFYRSVIRSTIGHALEAGRIDAAVLDPTLSQRLTSKGFRNSSIWPRPTQLFQVWASA